MPNEKIIEFDLNFIPQGTPPIVHIHQYDVGTVVTLKPTLYYGKDTYDGEDLASATVIIAYARPDGSKQSYTIRPTVEANVISFPLDGLMTAMWGPNVMSIGFQMPGNRDILWTQNFVLRLERHPIQAEDYIGSSAYDGMIQTLHQYIDEAYSSTPPGYEEHIQNIEEVMQEIEQLHSDINNSYDEATQYTDEKIGGLDSIYATLQDVIAAREAGAAYAGQLVGDAETRILEDTNLLYTTKEDFNDATIGMQIYAEHVATSSVLEAAERLGIEFTDTGANIVETGALSAEISKRADEIKTTLSADFATKEYVDDKETSIMSSSQSMIDQKANEINLTVRSNYESKDDANDKLLRSQSYTDSQIEMMSGSITQRVNAYTDSSLRNLKIGAANLLRGTNVFKTEDDAAGWVPSYNNGGWQKVGTATVSEIDEQTRPGSGFTNQVAMSSNAMLSQNKIDWFVDGKNYVAHMWIKKPVNMDLAGDKFLWFRNSLTGEKITYAVDDQDSTNDGFSVDANDNLEGPIEVDSNGTAQHAVDGGLKVAYSLHNPTYQVYGDEEGNFLTDTSDILKLDKVIKYDAEDESSEWVELDVYFSNKTWPQLVDVVIGDGQTAFTFAGLKIEEGNKVTSWYPNEFDFTDFFSSRLIQTYDSVMSSVYGQYTNDEDGDDIRTKWGSLSAYVNNVAGRVTTMASANYITVDDLTGSDTATHNVVTNLIKSTVSSNWENLNTINAIGSGITTNNYATVISSWARSDMKLGGPNILRATDTIEALVAQNKGTWSLDGWYKTSGGGATVTRIDVTNAPNNNIKKGWRFTATASTAAGNTDISQDEVPLGYQKPYTMSCYVRVTSGSGKLRFQSWRAANVYHNGPSDTGAIDVSAETHGAWTRVTWTFTHDFSDYKDQTNIHFGLQNTANTACVMEICGLKLEYGNLATDWQWSIYDVEAYTEARFEVLNNAINSYVLKTDYTGTNIISKVNQVDGQVYISGARVNLESNTTFTNVRTIANKVTDSIKQGSIQRLYYQKRASDSNKHTAPSKPSGSSKITTSTDNYDTWSITLPSYASGATWWTCEQYQDMNDAWHFTDVEAYNYTQIDGGNIRTGTVIVGDQLKLGGEMSVFTANKDSTTTGGYIGYESGNNGVRDTNGMILRSTGSKSYDSFAGKQTWPSYIHVSDSGIVIRSAYLQLRQSGSQAVKIINDNGLNLKEYANTGGVKITAQSRDDDAVAANLTMYAKTLSFDCSNNNIYFNPHTSGDTIYFQRGTSANEAQIGSYSSNFTTGKTWWTHGWFQNVGTQSGGVVSLSDRRSKKDIKYNIINGDLIDALKPARFKMIGDTNDRYHFGLIAQDVLDVYPDLVGSWGDGEDQRYNLSYEAFIPFLISKCQKLQKQIDELKGESS